jgi:hypothetical protein
MKVQTKQKSCKEEHMNQETMVARLYEQLTEGKEDFSENLSWLAEEARNERGESDRRAVWQVYRDVMKRVGGDLFDNDLAWNPHSDCVEPVLRLLAEKGYARMVMNLFSGLYNLQEELRPYNAHDNKAALHSLMARYYPMMFYPDEILKNRNWGIGWEYLDRISMIYDAAFDIVDGLAEPVARPVRETHTGESAHEIYVSLLEGVERQAYPVTYVFRRFFRRLRNRRSRK